MIPVLIIGAGFAGAASAYFLSQNPHLKIRLVEKEDTFGVHASGRNAAMIRQGVPDLQVGQWIQETLEFLKEPPSDWQDPDIFNPTGSLLLGNPTQLQTLFDTIQKVGGKGFLFSAENFSKILPERLQGIFKGTKTKDGLYCPGDGVVRLKAFLKQLLQSAENRGVEIFYQSEVTQLRESQGVWQVIHGGCEFEAQIIVNGAGAWANSLAKLGGLQGLELIPHRRHLFKSVGWSGEGDDLPLIWDVDQEVYYRTEGKELMLSPGDEEPHAPGEPQVDPRARVWLEEKLQSAFPWLPPIELGEGWACLRTKGKDGKLYIKQDTEKQGFFWVAGLGGHGVGASIGLGRACGYLVDQWIKT